MIKDKRTYNIFIIEDNIGDFEIVEEFLGEQFSAPVISHSDNYKQASDIITGQENRFDVILLDLSLPDKSGQSLIDEVIKIADSYPIVILTGHKDIDFSIRSISQGISDYLVKDDLNSTILYKSIIYAIERKKTMRQLLESEKKYSDLFQFTPQPMWVYASDSRKFLSVNKAALETYGYTEEEFLEMTLNDLQEDVRTFETLTNNTADNTFKNKIFKYKTKDNSTLHVEVKSSSIPYNNSKAELILANDVTDRVMYVKAIELQNRQLKEISWMQSHVVRAPLARLMGLVALIEGEQMLPTECEELFKYIIDSANELDIIIRDIVKKTESAV